MIQKIGLKFIDSFWVYLIIGAIGLAGYLFYINHQDQQKQIEQHKQEVKANKEDALVKVANIKYIKTLIPICDKKVKDITGIDFFRCEKLSDINIIQVLYLSGILDLKSSLADPNIPEICQKKIGEISASDFIDCLNEPTPEPDQPSSSQSVQ